MGAIRLREDARISLGNFSAAARRKAPGEFRDAQGAAGVARRSGRISVDSSTDRGHARGHGTGFGGAAENVGPFVPFALRPAEYFSGERGRGPSPVGDGLLAAPLLRPRRPRRGGILART